jgi:hypothetical protein
VRAIKLLLGAFADALIEGKLSVKADDMESAGVEFVVDKDDEEDDEKLMGPSTLSKLRNAKLDNEPDEEEA